MATGLRKISKTSLRASVCGGGLILLAVYLLMAPEVFAQSPLEESADLNKDGAVTAADVILFSYTFGETVETAASDQIRREIIDSDFNKDGRVDEMDLFYILSKWKPAKEDLANMAEPRAVLPATGTLDRLTPRRNPPQSQSQPSRTDAPRP